MSLEPFSVFGRLGAMAKKPGSQILKEIMAAPPSARSKMVYDLLMARNVPSWQYNWRPVVIRDVADGKSQSLEVMVSPDYLCLGDDDDFFRIPLTPKVAQAFADEMDAILPSRKLVNEIYEQSNGKLTPMPIADNKATLTDWAKHEIQVQQQQKAQGFYSGMFLAGHKKDIVTGPNLNGSRVAIYGWHRGSGDPIQPYSTIHDADYMDYAHGTRLVRRHAELNGEDVDLYDIFSNPKLASLVSDQGPFKPRYPYKPPTDEGGVMAFGRTSATSSLAASASKSLSPSTMSVQAAQSILQSLGYDLGPSGADGKIGDKTRAAISKFQGDNGLPQTGTLDDATKAKLAEKRPRSFRLTSTQKKMAWAAGGTVAVLGLGFLAKRQGWI